MKKKKKNFIGNILLMPLFNLNLKFFFGFGLVEWLMNQGLLVHQFPAEN